MSNRSPLVAQLAVAKRDDATRESRAYDGVSSYGARARIPILYDAARAPAPAPGLDSKARSPPASEKWRRHSPRSVDRLEEGAERACRAYYRECNCGKRKRGRGSAGVRKCEVSVLADAYVYGPHQSERNSGSMAALSLETVPPLSHGDEVRGAPDRLQLVADLATW